MSGRRSAGTLGLLLASLIWQGCNTCRPEQPAVQPHIGGAIGVGSGGVSHAGGVGLDVSNLFCRAPATEAQPQPGPGSPPIEDPTPQAPAKPTESQGP